MRDEATTQQHAGLSTSDNTSTVNGSQEMSVGGSAPGAGIGNFILKSTSLGGILGANSRWLGGRW